MALRLRCEYCKRYIPFSRGMLGTRIACPHCGRSFMVNSAPPDPSQAPAAPAASAEPNAPANTPAPVVDVVTPKPPSKSNIAASVERTGSDAYDLKPDPEPEVQPKPSKPATPANAASPKPSAAAPPKPAIPPVTEEKPAKGLFSRLFSRSR